MKRVLIISLLAIVGAAIGTWAAAAWFDSWPENKAGNGRLAAPRIVLPTSRRDLGTVPADRPLQARFAIHNDGSRRLIVRRDGACCGDTDTDDVTIVSPGHSAELVATINGGGQIGRVEETLAYTTNDPELPRFDLTVSANFVSRRHDARSIAH